MSVSGWRRADSNYEGPHREWFPLIDRLALALAEEFSHESVASPVSSDAQAIADGLHDIADAIRETSR